MLKNHFILKRKYSFFCINRLFFTGMYRASFFICVGLILNLWAHAQDANRETAEQIVEIANEAYYNLRVLIVANEQYVQAAEIDPTYTEANYMAGKTFLESNFKSKAAKYLERVYDIDPEYRFNILYMIGQGHQYGGAFERAIEFYNRYLTNLDRNPNYLGSDYTSREEVERRIYECTNGIDYKSNPEDYTIENVGPEINSEWDDFAPVLTENEDFMVFTTRRQDGNTNENVFDDMLYYEDIFQAKKSAGGWEKATNIGAPINNLYHDSNLAINSDGTELYLFKSQNGGDIFVSYKMDDGTWTEPESLDENINSSYSENSVSISPDGMVLFFSSDRPITEDKTDLDLYYSQKDRRGRWGRARNLGEVINTPFDEDGPFIDYDGKTLYFSSKGHKGMGGYDIYKSVYDSASKEWGQPINLGFPMNSPDNDIYFVSTRDGRRGYYASAREDGYGFTDIYQIKLAEIDESVVADSKKVDAPENDNQGPDIVALPPEEEPEEEEEEAPAPVATSPVVMILKTVDSESNEVINVDLSVSRLPDNKPVNLKQLDEGLYQVNFNNPVAIEYRFTAQRSGYMFKNISVTIPAASAKTKELRRYIPLDRIREGFSVVLRNIYFDFNRSTLKSSSFEELRKVKQILEQNPNYRIEIGGHTDSVGPSAVNQAFSEKRAQSVVNYLVKLGVSRGRLVSKGYGESRPLASNDDERDGRELNRRVEFKVLNLEK